MFIFFGLVAVCGTYYVQAGAVSAAACWAAFPVGLLATALLVVNNLRDIHTDRAAGKRTLAVRLGVTGARAEYLLLVGLAYLTPLLMVLVGEMGPWLFSVWLSLPLFVPLVRLILHREGRVLNQALAGTARLELVYGLLFSLGLIVPALF